MNQAAGLAAKKWVQRGVFLFLEATKAGLRSPGTVGLAPWGHTEVVMVTYGPDLVGRRTRFWNHFSLREGGDTGMACVPMAKSSMLDPGLACGKFNAHPSVLPEPKEGMVASGQGPVGSEGSGARPPETPAYPLPPPLDTPGLSEPRLFFWRASRQRSPPGAGASVLWVASSPY